MNNQFGDFQTPNSFTRKVVKLLKDLNFDYQNIIEPTFGKGNFIKTSLELFNNVESISGLELQKNYFLEFKNNINYDIIENIWNDDFFNFDISKLFYKDKTNIVIGNPPWITKSQLKKLNSKNSQINIKFDDLKGLDAMTGKSNFDISEYMAIQLLKEMDTLEKKSAMAFLVKKSVARNVLKHLNTLNIKVSSFDIFNFNAKKVFNISIDACLMLISIDKDSKLSCNQANIFELNNPNQLVKKIGFIDGKFVSDFDSYIKIKEFDSETSWNWRSGIKHDLSKILELTKDGDFFINGIGEKLHLELKDNDYVYPLIKSSDIRKNENNIYYRKYIILPQKKPSNNTSKISLESPIIWEYLNNHLSDFKNRKSAIYINKDVFSVFGVGDYSFAPYKIAISGMYKKAIFSPIFSTKDKPIMLDDTIYSLSFNCEKDAIIVLGVLRSDVVENLLSSISFIDAKRPYTKEILKRIDIIGILSKYKLEFLKNSPIYLNLTESDLDEFIDKYSRFK